MSANQDIEDFEQYLHEEDVLCRHATEWERIKRLARIGATYAELEEIKNNLYAALRTIDACGNADCHLCPTCVEVLP